MILCGETIGTINRSQEDKILSLKALYEHWNERINVISRKDMDQFYIHHVLHSLAIAKVFNFKKETTILDLGCGGGFPGIPLAIVFPEVHFHLVDSIRKKIKVVQEVSASLSLQNITWEHSRAEDIRDQKFDVVVSRAVAPLKTLISWSRPLLKKNSESGLICLKGGDLKNEIKESGRKTKLWPIFQDIYQNEWFQNKFIVQTLCQ